MATLVLTAIGTAIGGPVGGAIGALAGQAADAFIFRPKGREGPRLTDLQVQTSRYGDRIPHIFGRVRVAGTVIWSTDLQEATSSAGGGKGQPSITSYRYSASFAVALSARRISGIGRIWADGNLLRGSAGDFKTPLGAFRLHDGASGQVVDPLIAAAVGLDQAPGFGGIAYALFEELQLADFGNRIPSLTFEIIADEAPVPLSALAAAVLAQPVTFRGGEEPLVEGYAADGSDCEAALAPLVDAYGLRWRFHDAEVALVDALATDRSLAADMALRSAEGRAEPAGSRRAIPLDQLPARIALRHFDPDRDYQAGQQSVERAGPGLQEEEIALPARLSADVARRLADRILRRRLQERRRIVRAFGWAALDFAVGDVLAIEGEQGAWLVEMLEWEGMAARLTLRSHGRGAVLPAAGDAGQPVLQPDLAQGVTTLVAIEMPPMDGTLAEQPRLFAGATCANAGWRRAALFRYRPETESAESIGSTAPRAMLGRALTALSPGAPWTIDARCHVDIELENVADVLLGVDDGMLLRGANLCALGPELLQFGEAIQIGPRCYRLSRLLRGWRGTEWACGLHVVDEPFLLVDPTRLATVPATLADMGMTIALRAAGLGDALPAEALLAVDGRSILPPAPVHAVMADAGAGDLHLRWTRRSRLGWLWTDGADVPLCEEREAYAVSVWAGETVLRSIEVTAPAWTYEAAARAPDLALAGGAAMRVEVRQIGTYGRSRPLILDLT